MPKILRKTIFSLKKTKANKEANNGIVATITDAKVGSIKVNP